MCLSTEGVCCGAKKSAKLCESARRRCTSFCEDQCLLWLAAFPSVWPSILALLAVLLLLSGIDDLVPLIICLAHRFVNRPAAVDPSLGEFLRQERRIAIF